MAEAEGMIAQTLPLDPGQHGTFPVASVGTPWLPDHLLGLSHGLVQRHSPPPKAQDVLGNRTDALPLRLPQRLRDLRRLQGLTQKALAQRAGITDVTISRIEQSLDASQVAIDTVVRLARALNVSLETLLGLDDEPPRG
jgi:DNA-binding XRE family transcriptional regulator